MKTSFLNPVESAKGSDTVVGLAGAGSNGADTVLVRHAGVGAKGREHRIIIVDSVDTTTLGRANVTG